MNSLLITLVCLCACTFAQESEDVTANLLVSKNILNKYLVQGKDISMEYRIFNVGDGTAHDVLLRDATFPANDFETVSGMLEAQWDRIPAGGNVSHAVIMRAVRPGYFNFSSADVTYFASESATDKTIGYSSAPGEGGIVTLKDYERAFSSHVVDWLVFALMTLPSLAVPYMLWSKSYTKYCSPDSTGKKSN